jgi:putative membrane protein
MSEKDPRVYFAAERTLLAWIRTAVALIGLGFVVARFGLFLRLVQQNPGEVDQGFASTLIGIAFVVSGGSFSALAALQFAAFLKVLTPEEKPRAGFTPKMSLFLAFAVSSAGLLLALYLSVSGV